MYQNRSNPRQNYSCQNHEIAFDQSSTYEETRQFVFTGKMFEKHLLEELHFK